MNRQEAKSLLVLIGEIRDELRRTNGMLEEIHHAVTNDLATKSDVNRAKRVVVKAILTNRNSEADLDGPQNETRRRQVEAVKALMRKAYHEGRRLTLNQACLEVWTPLKDGYPTPKALYEYCHAHEIEF